MPVIPIYLNIDEETYACVMNGTLELCGLAKTVDGKKIAKHIPAIADATKEGAAKAIDFIRGHKTGTLLMGGVVVVGGAVAGTVNYISQRRQRKLNVRFGEAFQAYLNASKAGTLTLETLNALLDSIDAIEQEGSNKSICLNVSSAQFNELIRCIFDYTLQLANANHIDAKLVKRPKRFGEKTAVDLKYYLEVQKQIFEHCA